MHNNRIEIKLMQEELPYGERQFEDGSAELFNRKYSTIATRGERTSNKIVSEKWFYTDKNPPWLNDKTKQNCERILRTWRLG